MNQYEKQKLIKFLVYLALILVFFGKAIPFLLIGLVAYLFYSRLHNKPVVPLNYERYFPEVIINFLNKNKAKIYQSPMETINPKKFKNIGRWLVPLVIFLVFLPFAGSFFTVIEAGNTGVRSLFGKVYDQELSSGFHLKNPLVKITKMNVRTQEYTMSILQGEGKNFGDDSIAALTKEGLQVDLDITVLYKLIQENASDVYNSIGLDYENVIIRPQARSTIREIIAQYEAKDIYSEKREEASQKIIDDLRLAMVGRGVEIEDVLLRNIQLPKGLAESIQQKLQAEQESERYDFVLDKEKKEAERKRLEAEGQRDAQTIINQSLTPKYLEFLYIQSLKDREGTIYVPTNPNNGLPVFRGI